MAIFKCERCGGNFEVDRRTRRRVVYKCTTCGRELPVKKWHNSKPAENSSLKETTT